MENRNPTARALRCLEVLQRRPVVAVADLAAELGVSDRAARRYITVLREAGVAVDSVRGPYGGYRLGRGLRLPPLVFGSAEALGLVMAVLDGHHAASDEEDLVGQALARIVRALPAPVAAQAEAVRRTAAAAPDRSAARPDPAATTSLVEATCAHRRVRVVYRSEAGASWTAEVDPWGLVVRHGRWYLLCHSHAAGAVRTYRVDRIGSVVLLDDTFVPPRGLDPVAVLEEHLAVGWEYECSVLVHAPVDHTRRHLGRALGRLEPVAGGRTRLTGSTSNPPWYAAQLAGLPVAFDVEGGPELRAVTRALGQRLLRAAGDA